MKRLFLIIFLMLGIIFLSGCFKSQPQSEVLISLNGSSLEDLKVDSVIKDEHIFKSYNNRITSNKIVFVNFGEKINLEFKGETPDFVYLTDSIINVDGEYLFAAHLDAKIEHTKVDEKKYSFIIDPHPAAYMVPSKEGANGIYRGIKIDVFFGEQKITYLLVIKTDIN